MRFLCKLLFGVMVLASLAALFISGGCANIPDDGMPDPEVLPVDTLVVVDTAVFDDTVTVCHTTIIGDSAVIDCDTVVLGNMAVPYMVTRVDSRINNYCLYPITFTAFPAAGDLEHIEAVYLDLGGFDGEGWAESVQVLLSPPMYSATFNFADTGTHSVRMLIAMKGSDFVLTEVFEVRTEMRVDPIEPIRIMVEDTGSACTFKATGRRPRDVFWVWDLTSIGGGVVKTLEDTASVFITGGHDTVIVVYQEDADGRRTPGMEVKFTQVILLHFVTVEVVGGKADISPRPEFMAVEGSDVSVGINTLKHVNTRIKSIHVNGVLRYLFYDTLVRDTVLKITNIMADKRVLVTVAEIDTVKPTVQIIWPYLFNWSDSVAHIPRNCINGGLVYRLNKRMASGFIRWEDLVDGEYQDSISLRTVNIPEDITPDVHNVAATIGMVFNMSPLQYLYEGVQRYNQTISPISAKRHTKRDHSYYRVEVGFTDSIGNVSAVESLIIGIYGEARGCPYASDDFMNAQ